jgi:uncharacterized membrane protein
MTTRILALSWSSVFPSFSVLYIASENPVDSMTLSGILAWFHILGAIGWVGAAMFFAIVVGPLLGKLTPGTRGELILKLFPRFVRYIAAFGTLTLVMGVALAFSVTDGNIGLLSPTASPAGMYITAGAILALVAIGIATGVVIPTANRIVQILQSMAQNPGPPPPELAKATNRLRRGAMTALVLLLVVLVFMVAAAWGT